MPTYQVTIGEQTLRIELRREGEATFARVNGGPEHPVRLAKLHGTLQSLLIGNQQLELLADRGPETVRLAINGLEYQAEVVDEAHARLAQVVGGTGAQHQRRELRAPMPGLVVKVLCEPGAQVEPGQPLIVLQAMKMENELSVPRAGTVKTVSAIAGQTVDQGAVLVVVE